MVGVVYVYVHMVFGFYEYFFFILFTWMFQHDCLDTYCLECLICMCFVFSYFHLFSACFKWKGALEMRSLYYYYYYYYYKGESVIADWLTGWLIDRLVNWTVGRLLG